MSSPAQPVRPRRPTREIPPIPIDTTASILTTDNTDLVDSPTATTSPTSATSPTSTLSPLRAHYLKKSLIQLQLHNEIEALLDSSSAHVSTLSFLGPPFTPPPKGVKPIDLPLLQYMFRQFILTFPFMASAPKDFYSDKLQPFVAAILARNISPNNVFDERSDRSETATRQKLLAKIERNVAMFVGSATKVVEPEQVVRLNQADLDRLENLAAKRRRKMMQEESAVFEVNVVTIRSVKDTSKMRKRTHEQFIIRTRRSHHSDVYVCRRHGDFKTLADELRKRYTSELVPNPPAKDRTIVNAGAASPVNSPTQTGFYDQYPSNPSTSSFASSNESYASSSAPLSRLGLAREKNRLTLRAYLNALLANNKLASSPVMQSFLLSGPTQLTADEEDDARRREDADRVREDGRKKFAKEIASRVDGLRDAVRSVKGDIMGKDGLTRIFATVKETPNVNDLPTEYKSVIEWARISLASTVFQQFVASDNASETLTSLKRIHGLMPYFMLKTALKISNPMAMIRTVLDLFLAQPFGGRSLLQRMFSSSLSEEVKVLQEDILAVKDKIDDEVICEKIRQFIYAPREIQDMLKADAVSEGQSLITIVLRSGDEPVLSRAQMHRISKAHRAHAIYMKQRESMHDSDDDDGPQDEDAWLYEDIKVLADLYTRLRDREMLIGLIFEGFTSELLKDIITIFYSPLAQVYKAASIADSLSDLQNFINDLIRTVEQVEELTHQDPQRTVQLFIDLIARHQQAFYSFVHKVHSKGEGLFDSLMRWIELFLTVVREGLGEGQPPVSLEFLLPHVGKEREDIMKETDEVARYHYRLKVLYEDKLRRRFGQAQGTAADVEDQATQLLVDGVIGEISFGELVDGDVADIAAEETDESEEYGSDSEEEDGETSSSSYETESDTTDDESEEGAPPPPPRTQMMSRQNTITVSNPTGASSSNQTLRPASIATPSPQITPKISVTTAGPTDTTPRPRAISLKTMRSMTFRRSNPSSPKTEVPPPVPPLPSTPLRQRDPTLNSKPLPNLPPSSSQPQPPTKPSKSHTNKSKQRSRQVKPPELVHIPQLLPVFIEMMRPFLRPRARTNLS